MREIIDPTTPRAQLPFEQLPRGFVPWPQRILDALEAEQVRKQMRFADEYVKRHLEAATLAYFYAGLDVAYRPADGGIEVVGLGWQEASQYLHDGSVKVAQA
jgi:hypothetical protein